MKKELFSVIAFMMAIVPFKAEAAEPVKADFGADIVSTYVWRGSKLDGLAIQPSLGLEWEGLSFGAWGSTGLVGDFRELDFTLAYSIGGLTVGLTDYWCADSATRYFDYTSETPHVLEANIGYDFGPVALNWYTNCLGAVGYTPDGKKAYSSYFEISAPFSMGGLDWSAAVGATPWACDFYGSGSFAVVNLSLTAGKTLELGSASLPVFAQLVANPSADRLYLVAGISF